jgi:hypothetical protein
MLTLCSTPTVWITVGGRSVSALSGPRGIWDADFLDVGALPRGDARSCYARSTRARPSLFRPRPGRDSAADLYECCWLRSAGRHSPAARNLSPTIAEFICSDDVGREFSVARCRQRSVGHVGSPGRDRQKYHAGQDRECQNRISIRYYAAPLTSFRLLASRLPPPEFCRIDLGR